MNKRNAKILVIDDEPGARDLLRYELTPRGFAVSTAANGKEALTMMEEGKFDLVISDFNMPEMDGLEALEAIKKADENIEIIMVTGYATIKKSVSAMQKGAYDFIEKPFDINEMQAVIERALEKKEMKALLGVYESSKSIFTSIKQERVLPKIIEISLNVLRADDVSVFLLNESGQLLVGASSIRADDPERPSRLRHAHTLAEEVLRARDLLEFQAALASPLMVNKDVLGVLIAHRFDASSPFSRSDLRNITIFGSQAAQAVYNAKIVHELETKVSELKTAYSRLEESQNRLLQSEKLAVVGRLAAGVAHELNNPLTGIIGLSQMQLSTPDLTPELREDLGGILREGDRCRKIIQNLLNFSRKSKPKKEPIDLIALLEDTLKFVEYNFSTSSVQIIKNFFPLPPVMGDPFQLRQVFLNILTNAKHALKNQTSKRIEVRASLKAEDRIQIQFSDNGTGIPHENISKIFDPFFSTKSVGEGTGLGLSLAYGILQEHGGSISVESEEKKGTKLTIELPCHPQEALTNRNKTPGER